MPIVDPFEKQQIVDPFARPEERPEAPPQIAGVPRIPADILAGLAQMGHGLIQAPSRIAGSLAAGGIISPEAAARVPKMPEYDYSKMLGIKQPGIGDILLQGATQYLPYALAGGATLPGITAAGAAYGATQTQHPVIGAGIGAATNLGLGLGGRAAANILSKYATGGLIKGIQGRLGELKDIKDTNAYQMAKQNFDNYEGIERNAWDDLTNEANIADTTRPDIKFDNKNYKNTLIKELSRLEGQAERQPGFKRENAQSIKLLKGYKAPDGTKIKGYIDSPHNTFTDAIEHNKSLNLDYKNEIVPGTSIPFSTVNFAKANLMKTMEQNLKDNNLEDTLGKSWDTANQATINKNRIFNEVTTPKGETKPSAFMKFYNREGGFAQPENFIKEYLPVGEGTQKMEQFAKMIGDDNYAKDVLKANYFDKTYDELGIKTKSFLNKFNKLSEEQQNYLFSSDEINHVKALSKIIAKNPDVLTKTNIGTFWHHSLPTLAGFGVGAMVHHPSLGILGGYLGGRAGEAGLGRIAEIPAIQKAIVGRLTQETPGVSGYLSSILKTLMPAAAVPQVTQTIGD